MSSFYAALAVAPLIGAPIQLIYLKAGKRYDVGSVFFVATGAFVGALFGAVDEQQAALVESVLTILIPISIIAVILRIIALSFLEPMVFTLVSLAQMWAIQPVVTYALERRSGFSVYVGQLSASSLVVMGGIAVNLAIVYMFVRLRLPSRLHAASDSPFEYSVLMGSRLRLAILLELGAVFLYFSAGIAFRLVHSNLSPDDFGGEGLWMLLSVAALPRFDWRLTVAGPLVAVVLRYLVATYLSASAAAIVIYILLSVVLAMTAIYEVQKNRVKRA
jgi:hypothetical protein